MKVKEIAAYCRERCETGHISPCVGCKLKPLCGKLENIAFHAPTH